MVELRRSGARWLKWAKVRVPALGAPRAKAVVYPSATLVRGYEPMFVATKSGATHSGILREDAADEVVLATGPDTEQRIARAEIAGIEPGSPSFMPPGMAVVLAKQELADLVAFLKSRQ